MLTKIANERGALLITMIVVMSAAAALGAGMLHFTTTATYEELFANRQARAYYLAEAGGRYTQILLYDKKDDPDYLDYYPGGESPAFAVCSLDGGDRFALSSREYVKNGTPDPEWVVVEVTGVVNENTWMESKRKITYIISRLSPFGDDSNFLDFLLEENVFVYGNTLNFAGNNVIGPGATMVIKGGLATNHLNGGASIAVTTIFIDGNVLLDGGSASLGSSEEPGKICVNGDLRLWNGSRNIYGDVYVNGNFDLKDARIHGNVYVHGNLTLGWTPWLSDDSRIYYTGTLSHPSYYDASILAKCIQEGYPLSEFDENYEMPDFQIPPPREGDWFAAKGYQSGGDLVTGLKVFTEGDYISSRWRPTAENVIIVSKGNISITRLGGSGLTGVLYAPYGRVTFNGSFFTGIVIARDGFFVTSGGTTVTFRGIEHYIDNPDDYPFQPSQGIIQY